MGMSGQCFQASPLNPPIDRVSPTHRVGGIEIGSRLQIEFRVDKRIASIMSLKSVENRFDVRVADRLIVVDDCEQVLLGGSVGQ